MTNLTHDDYLLLAFITAHPDDDKARAYQIGYASGLKAKAEEMSKSVEKLFPATILDKKVEQVKR
jgi:hypothetical protein